MKPRHLPVILALILALLTPMTFITPPTASAQAVLPLSQEPDSGLCRDGTVLVTLAAPSRTSLSKRGAIKNDPDIRVEKVWDFGNAKTLGKNKAQKNFLGDKTLYVSRVVSDTYSIGELTQKLEKHAYVVSVEPDYYQKKMTAKQGGLTDSQWYLDGDGNYLTESEGIHYSEAGTFAAEDTPVVAVVDTGVDYTHEDLASRMWQNPYSDLPGKYGYDFGDNDPDPMDEDEDGHGTHCAGVIAAEKETGTGIDGVADCAQIMALKVFNTAGNISNSYIVDAFNYIYRAQKLGANIAVVNCSWGGGDSTSAMEALIDKIGQNGALFVFAAGNDEIDHDLETSPQCPYDMDSQYIVIVGASDMQDNAAPFSDYGQAVHLFAPGTQILSTVNQGMFSPAFYTEEERERLCTFYSGCPDDGFTLYTPADLGLSSAGTTYYGAEHSQVDLFNDPRDGSVSTDFYTSGRYGNTGSFVLYMDVTDLEMDTNKEYIVSFDAGYEQEETVIWEHFYHEVSKGSFVRRSGRIYLKLVGLYTSVLDSLQTMYIDNPAISTVNPDVSEFGKYASLNGTSMSSPLVSAAVADLYCAYPSDTVIERKNRLLNCTRPCSSLSGLCSTGGVLDLTKITTATTVPPVTDSAESKNVKKAETTASTAATKTETKTVKENIKVKKVKLNKASAKLHYGKKLKLKASVSPKNASNKKIKWSSAKKKYATVTQKGVVKAKKKGIGHKVKICAKAKDGSGKKSYCKVKIVK